jgi:hypothetical protein
MQVVTTFVVLAVVIFLALTGNEMVAAATVALGVAAGSVHITVHIRR